MQDDLEDPAGRSTREDPENSEVTASVSDRAQSELEDDEFGHAAATAVGGLVPEGVDDDHP